MGKVNWHNPKPVEPPLPIPPSALLKIQDLESEGRIKGVEQNAIAGSQVGIIRSRDDAQRRLAHAELNHAPHPVPADERARLEREVKLQSDALAASHVRASELNTASNVPRALAKKGRQYLADYQSSGLREAKPVELPLGTYADVVDLARAEQRALCIEREEMESRLPPQEVMLERALRKIATVDAPFRVRVDVKKQPRIDWETVLINAEPQFVGQSEPPQTIDAERIALWLARDQIVDEVKRQISELYDEETQVATDDEKKRAIAAIDARVLASERIEAEALWAARREGVELPWRETIDIRCVLGLIGPRPQRRDDD